MKLSRLLTVFELADVADQNVRDRKLHRFAAAYTGHLVLRLDLVLQPAKLLLLLPVVKGRDEDHHGHRRQNGHALYPPRFRLRLILRY